MAARMPMLLPSPNPRLRPFSIRRTPGNSRRTSSWLPSVDPLSTTIVWQGYVCARSELRHSRSRPPPFQPMTMTETFAVGTLLEDVAFRRRRRQLAVRVGQALHLGDVGVVLPLPVVAARPLAVPVLRVDERPGVLELLSLVEQLDALDDPELVAHRQAVVDHVLVDGHAARLDDERVAFPVTDRLAVVRADDFVLRRELPAVEIDDPDLVFEAADHVDRRRQLHHRDRPHPRHEDGHAGRIALADPVAVVPALLLGGLALDE